LIATIEIAKDVPKQRLSKKNLFQQANTMEKSGQYNDSNNEKHTEDSAIEV
jgi:hypothetical protein